MYLFVEALRAGDLYPLKSAVALAIVIAYG